MENKPPQIIILNYPWGKIESESSYVDGILNGWRKKYHYNEVLASEEYFLAGTKNGLAKYYSEHGPLIKESNFTNDLLHGEEKIYHTEEGHFGKIYNINQFQNGKKHGSFKVFNRSSILIELSTYVEGELCGPFEKYTEEGIPIAFYNWKDNTTREGIQKIFYANGQVNNISILEDGKKHGPSIQYHYNGRIGSIKCYQNGIEHKDMNLCLLKIHELADPLELSEDFLKALGNNLEVSYHDNGNLKEKFTRKAGKREGNYKVWYNDGTVLERGQYKNDLLEGYIMAYFPDGKIKIIRSFEEGKKHGLEKEYNDGRSGCTGDHLGKRKEYRLKKLLSEW